MWQLLFALLLTPPQAPAARDISTPASATPAGIPASSSTTRIWGLGGISQRKQSYRCKVQGNAATKKTQRSRELRMK